MPGRDEIAKELLDEMLPENPEDAVRFLEDLNILLMRYDSAIREVRTKLEILNDELSMTSPQSPIASIASRRKKASRSRSVPRRDRYPSAGSRDG